MPHQITITRQPDKNIIDFFKRLNEKHTDKIEAIHIHTAASVSFDSFHTFNTKNVLTDNSCIVSTIRIEIPRFLITYRRGGNIHDPSPFLDTIEIDPSYSSHSRPCPFSDGEKLELILNIDSLFGTITAGRTIGQVLGKEQRDLLAIHNETLTRLERLSEKLIKDTNAFRFSLEKETERRCENRFAELDKEFYTKTQKLAEKEDELSKKLKEVDSRNNTFVRRELRENILKEIQSRSKIFSLTVGTNKLRKPIHAAFVALIMVLTVGAWYYGVAFVDAATRNLPSMVPLYILGFKQLAFTVGTASMAIFYLRWMSSWAKAHADAEFSLKQFQLDIDRASWVVETALEWENEKNKAMPEHLLREVTRNLFSHGDSKESPLENPTDHLASAILGKASKVKVKAGESELEFEGKKLTS